ncbi:hypothetical protein [Leptospira licerasiae]|uniref:Uncharacterized protein n=1 Tax=Leptospira licerasiae str. MMD4847 TaxID=1049971 RepID=A0ABN0HDU0_9LEPT|nr:hypothetical protein [Leptospira licerasiae]EJZ43757.1 hypothetical protein LEP1GSC178_2328 [Leptospira licerasiae str. MMD4847]
MKKPIVRPSHKEFVDLAETEFLFLEVEYSFRKEWDSVDAFHVTYSNSYLKIHIRGWSYGEYAYVTIFFGEEELPYHEYITSFSKKLTPTTGKNQLDDLKEYAYRLKFECREILEGNFTCLIPYRPFPNAEKVWRKRDYSEIVRQLQNVSLPLSEAWSNRLEHAKKNVKH